MATTATHPYLGTLQFNTTGSTYVDLGQLVDFTPPKVVWGKSDTSHLASTDATRTSTPGWADPGEIPFTINMLTADYNTLLTRAKTRVVSVYRVRFNDGTTPTTGTVIGFSAWISELGVATLSKDDDNPLRLEGKLIVSGVHTLTVSS